MSNATAPAEQVTCRRCHRALTSAASKLAGIGPRCAAVEAATAGLSARQVEKLMQVITDKGIAKTGRKGVYRVVSENGGGVHIAHVNGNCTCEWGLRRTSAMSKTCYAVAGARLAARPQVRFAKAA
jgi:hypothetical protein